MRWKRIIRKLRPEQLVDIFIEIILEILDAWAILRTLIILAFVLVTILSSTFTDEQKSKGSLNESSWMVDWMHSTNK